MRLQLITRAQSGYFSKPLVRRDHRRCLRDLLQLLDDLDQARFYVQLECDYDRRVANALCFCFSLASDAILEARKPAGFTRALVDLVRRRGTGLWRRTARLLYGIANRAGRSGKLSDLYLSGDGGAHGFPVVWRTPDAAKAHRGAALFPRLRFSFFGVHGRAWLSGSGSLLDFGRSRRYRIVLDVQPTPVENLFATGHHRVDHAAHRGSFSNIGLEQPAALRRNSIARLVGDVGDRPAADLCAALILRRDWQNWRCAHCAHQHHRTGVHDNLGCFASQRTLHFLADIWRGINLDRPCGVGVA